MESSEDETLLQSSVLSPYVKPTNDDLIDELCLFLNTVDDVTSLEQVTFFRVSLFHLIHLSLWSRNSLLHRAEWVISSKPYPITLTLRQLKKHIEDG